ncbi:MAG: DUF302 domain-containing protein [Chromatiales bacterium]|jgi:uncharacterized protein (DUF302 family)
MNHLFRIFLLWLLATTPLFAAEGMVNVASQHNVADTVQRLLDVLNGKGMTVFAHVKHSAAAHKVGIELRDTELVIFGNPKVGSPLMQCQQSVALDLPQKALVWQDEQGAVWLSYNDPNYLAQRHAISGCDEVLAKISKALAGISAAATQ